MQDERFTNLMKALGADLIRACRDLTPIVIALFLSLILHQPLPELVSVLAGPALVVVGLALFVVGLDIGRGMLVNLICAGLAGASILLIMKKICIDPVQSSTIIITTATDVLGFLAFLGFAVMFQDALIA